MQNYVYLYHVDTKIELTEEQNAMWGKWFGTLGENLVDGGNPFNPKNQAQVSNGKVDMDSDTVSGYSIVKANTLEEAVTWAMTCPLANAPGCSVKVYETMPM